LTELNQSLLRFVSHSFFYHLDANSFLFITNVHFHRHLPLVNPTFLFHLSFHLDWTFLCLQQRELHFHLFVYDLFLILMMSCFLPFSLILLIVPVLLFFYYYLLIYFPLYLLLLDYYPLLFAPLH